MSFWRDVGTLLWKDLLLEVRTKEVIYAVLFYAVMAVMIFSFAFTVEPKIVVQLAPGMFWVAKPEKAARQMMAAINRRARVAYVTRRWALVALGFRLVPRALYERG